MQLELVGTAEDGNDGGIRGVNPATRQFEVGMSYSDIGKSGITFSFPFPRPQYIPPQKVSTLLPRLYVGKTD